MLMKIEEPDADSTNKHRFLLTSISEQVHDESSISLVSSKLLGDAQGRDQISRITGQGEQ